MTTAEKSTGRHHGRCNSQIMLRHNRSAGLWRPLSYRARDYSTHLAIDDARNEPGIDLFSSSGT
jgi:hypothetical protein